MPSDNLPQKYVYTIGYASEQRMRSAAEEHGASEAELLAIEHLSDFTADDTDLARLRPLAELAGVELPEATPHAE